MARNVRNYGRGPIFLSSSEWLVGNLTPGLEYDTLKLDTCYSNIKIRRYHVFLGAVLE